MGIVYQLTFFVSLGMLGIVVAVFVFAVTQIGSATKTAAKEQENKMLEKRKVTLSRIESMEEKLAEGKRSGELNVSGLSSEVVEMNEEIENYDVEIKRIKERIGLITRRGAIVYPGGFFLVALVLSITSSGLAGNDNLGTLGLWVWAVSLVPLVFGAHRVYRSLGVVEEVTVGSGEVLDKLPEAVKLALRELEEERKPELKMVFIGEEPPIRMVVGERKKIRIGIDVTKGEVAFFAPVGFNFLGRAKTMLQAEDVGIVGGMLGGFYKFGDCRNDSVQTEEVIIKAHSEAGVYEFFYTINCEGFSSGFEEMEVEVVEADEK